MSVVAVIGAQWGDEGKGRVIDLLAAKADVVARYQGGSNAGHTVINHLGTFRLHLVPSGIFDPHIACVIGNGVVIHPKVLLDELAGLRATGIDTDNLHISDRAHVVMPYHVLLDRLEEEARGDSRIGTTGRGVGPAYVDKVARVGIRMVDLVEPTVFRAKLEAVLRQKNQVLTRVYGAEPLDPDAVFGEYVEYGQELARYVTDTGELVRGAQAARKNVLLEGGQGTLLDVDFGTYPYVTSSSAAAGGVATGVGLGPTRIDRIVGVIKAYITRVGSGPFPTELDGEYGQLIRQRGSEFGTTTGRPRRCGWFDAVLARYSVAVNGLDGVAITKLDVLDSLPTVRIATGYRLDGRVSQQMPASLEILSRCEPVYEEMPGWQQPTGDVRHLEDLPPQAQDYVRRLGELIGCPTYLVSVGYSREQMIVLRDVFE
jgi:adenylosuccinate synthase